MWNSGITIKHSIQIDSIITAFTVERGKDYSFHGEAHDFWEMVYIKRGLAGITADGKVFECSPETIVFHKPNEFHRIWNANNESIQFTVISFKTNSEYVTEKLSNAIISLPYKCRYLISEIQSIINSSGPFDNYLPSNFRNGSNHVTLAYFCTILEVLLYECAFLEKRRIPNTNTSAKIFSMAVEIMQKNISQPIKSQQIADELNISLSHLKRIFNHYAFTGIHEYFLAIKIERAKDLLLQGEPVNIVAEQVGFYNPNYFSTTFKRQTGFTPTQWLKILK